MKKEFRTYNGFILKEGKKYKWSGFSDGLYTAYRWTDCKCKIKSVDGDKITIYDYRDNIEYNYNNNQLCDMKINFKLRKNIFNI